MKRLLFATAVSLLALAACNREPVVQEAGSLDVRFTSNIENTFSVKSLDPLAEGKTVRILAGAPISKNTDATVASGGKLTPETVIKWKENQADKTTFVGIYPSHEETSATISNYSLVDEFNGQDIEYHNNFLVALAKDVTPGETVNLAFRHPFVKLVIDIDNQLAGTPEIGMVSVSDVITSGNLILDAGTIVPASTKGNVRATKNASTGKFEAIIMPQADAKPVISLYAGSTLFTFKINAATTFVAGKVYTATLSLKDERVPVGFGLTVVDWEADSTPLVATEVVDQWSVVGDVTGAWENDLIMVEGATPGVLEATINYHDGDEFKLRLNGNWTVSAGLKDGVEYVGDSNWDGHLDSTSNNIKLQTAGVYDITFKPEGWVFTATRTGDLP